MGSPTCKGICSRDAVKNNVFIKGRYINGQKRCRACEVYFKTQRIRCECCNSLLVAKPKRSDLRHKVTQARLLERLRLAALNNALNNPTITTTNETDVNTNTNTTPNTIVENPTALQNQELTPLP